MRSLPSLLPFALILAACGDDGNADTSGAATSGLTSASASASGSAGGSTSGSASGSSGAASSGGGSSSGDATEGSTGGGGPAVCGDGVVEGDEACDDGAANADDVADACRTDCSAPRCGDGVIDPGHGEVCDPMALAPGESCSVECDARRERFELGLSAVAYDLVRDADDGLHLVWKASNGPAQGLHYGRIVDGALVMQEAIPGSEGARTRGFRPRFAVDPAGERVHVAWSDQAMTQLFHTWRIGQVWEPGAELFHSVEGVDNGVAQAASAIDADGLVHILATTWDPVSILYWRRPLGEDAWLDQAAVLEGPTNLDLRSTVALSDRAGDVHATYKGVNVDGRYLFAPSGGSLVDSEKVSIPGPEGGKHAGMGDLWVRDDGALDAAFRTWDVGVEGEWYARRPAGAPEFVTPTTKVGPIQEAPGGLDYDQWPAIAADPSGRVLVAWAENPAATPDRVSRVFLGINAGDGFEVESLDDDAEVDAFSKPAMSATAEATYVLWNSAGAGLVLLRLSWAG
ncbi:MAG: hypothetical protein H6711_35250 [Myxococcales bacterium]|nr:hypothetical protein [Myxococcales bacterium]